MNAVREQLVFRFFGDRSAFSNYLGTKTWSGWGIDGDPEQPSWRSRLLLRATNGGLEVEVRRARPYTGIRFRLRSLLYLPVLQVLGQPDTRRFDEAEARVEADLVVLEGADSRLTLQALDASRVHAVLYLGSAGRLRFAGPLQR